VVDFYAERSGEKTQQALKEHYGIELSLHAVQKSAAQAAKKAQELNSHQPQSAVEASATLVAQVDGSMVPIVGFKEPKDRQEQDNTQDRRKLRYCHWKEIRLATAHEPTRSEPRYGVALGESFEVGCMLFDTCRFEGMTAATHIHGVSDGAPWIASQFEQQFGTQHTFLVDFYHVCEYLAEASKNLTNTISAEDWYEDKKTKLKEGNVEEVLNELKSQSAELENTQSKSEEENAIKASYRYLNNRSEHLNYATAIEKGLPIGSGEIESAHRSVLQSRLKIAGAWWSLEMAEKMAHLRVLRANNRWDELWQQAA